MAGAGERNGKSFGLVYGNNRGAANSLEQNLNVLGRENVTSLFIESKQMKSVVNFSENRSEFSTKKKVDGSKA